MTYVLHGDALDELRKLPAQSFDALVTDPPAGIEFMGAAWDTFRAKAANPSGFQTDEWDQQGSTPFSRSATPRYAGKVKSERFAIRDAFISGMVPIFEETIRVLKPGAHGVVWAIPRTSHWTATALEDAGFEIRDVLTHHFGSGFPKHPHVLKPGSEHWILVRAPLDAENIDENIERWGTGGLNVDACRVGTDTISTHGAGDKYANLKTGVSEGVGEYRTHVGRWPANVVFTHSADCVVLGPRIVSSNGHYPGERGAGGLGTAGHAGQEGLEERYTAGESVGTWECADGCPVQALDAQSGVSRSASGVQKYKRAETSGWHAHGVGGVFTPGREWEAEGYGDAGGASRFFPTFGWSESDYLAFRYEPKASRSERDARLIGLPTRTVAMVGNAGTPTNGRRDIPPAKGKNYHPTVKPVALMRWLCRLVTPKGGHVLDPFAGSGTTLVAAIEEGFEPLGIERMADYIPLIERRIDGVQRGGLL